MYSQLLCSNLTFLPFWLLFLPFINVGVIKPISSLEVNTQSQLEIPQYVLQSAIRDTQSQS